MVLEILIHGFELLTNANEQIRFVSIRSLEMLTTSQEQRQEFVQLLRLTLVTDNQQRKMSEDRLNSIDSVVKTKLLLDVIMNETNEEVVQAAALMLRRLIIQIKIVSPDQASYLNEIKVTIPTLCLKEKNIAIRNKLVDVLSELIKLANFEESFTYDEAPQFFYQCISSNDEVGKLIAFRILDSSASVAIKFSDQQLCEVYKKISEVMSLNLATHNNLVVEAVRAFTNLTLYLPKNKSGQFFNTPFQILMHIVKTCNEPDCCVEILEELDELIESCREMIKPSLLLVVETLLAVLSSQQADEATRVGAMESLVLLAQKLKKEFQESCQPYYENIVDILMRHLMLVEDDPNWACSTEEDDEDDNDIASEAESSLDRIVCVVRGKAMFHIIKDKTSLLLSSKVWQHRYAALSTISCVAEGAHKQMKQYLPSIVDAIVPFMFDEHPRVVYACITCIGQLSTDFDEYLTSNFHEKIIPLMFQASEFYISFPKIRAHAVCCFVNLIDASAQNILELYADKFFHSIRNALIQSINEISKPGVQLVLENSLTAMSKLAASLVDKFAKYYPNIVPELLALLRSLSSTLHTKFYIAALDALGHILMAVGLEKCKPDIGAVLAIVKQFEIGTIKKESGRDFQLEYLEILVYLARVLGANFSPIIPHLLPTLFELTSAPLDNPLVNSPWAVIEDLTGSSTMPRLLSAHTDAVEDRVNALSIVNKLFKLLKGDMLPHVEAMLDITIKNFTEIFDESVQLTCLQLFANLLKSAETSQTDLSVRIWEKIFNVFCNRVLNHNPLFEPEQTFEGIEKCLKVLSFKGINDQLLVKTMEIMKVEIDRTIKDYGSTIPSKTPEEETITPDDDDYSDFEDDMESGERSLSAIMDLQRYLFKQLGAKFLPFWEQVHNDVFGLSQVLNPSMRSYSIYMFSNLFEFAPAESVNSTDNVLGVIIRGLSDPELTVRHSAVSTVGTVSEFASAHYKQFLEFVLPVIVKMICSTPASKVRDSVIDCAISVVGKIMKYQPAIIMSFDTAVQTWISWLPIQDDDVNFALEYLLELIETKFQVVAGPDNSGLVKALNSIVDMLPYADTKITHKSIKILDEIQKHAPEVFNRWYQNLDDDQKLTMTSSRCSN